MYKYILCSIILLSACTKSHNIQVAQQPLNKPDVSFNTETFEKPTIIIEDRCYLVNSPKTPVICMLPSEYDKETMNYRKMLDILKQYQAMKLYYSNINKVVYE